MLKVSSILLKYKNYILISIIIFIAFGFSLLSSYIVQSLGCGVLSEFIDCGYYAGFPAPYAKYKVNLNKTKSHTQLLNPTYYYKFRYSPLVENRVIAEKMIKDGKMFPFYLQDQNVYQLNKTMFIINSILWIAPSVFMLFVFY